MSSTNNIINDESSSSLTSLPRRLYDSLTISPKLAFLLVSMALGQLGDGLNIFQGIYLVSYGGWNEGSVGAALSLMGLTALLVQPFAGDFVDKATVDRRLFLCVASIVTAISASTILFVVPGANTQHFLIYTSKICEGIASSFIGPCLAALTLASFGPNHFDNVMASNIYWGHVGSVLAAILAGLVAYIFYPDNIQYCFLVIGASAIIAIFFVQYLPQGDPLMGRGFHSSSSSTTIKIAETDGTTSAVVPQAPSDDTEDSETSSLMAKVDDGSNTDSTPSAEEPKASSYLEVFLDFKTCVLCLTGFFFHFANANVLLVLGELMGSADDSSDGTTTSSDYSGGFDDDATTLATQTSTVAATTATTTTATPSTSRTAIPLTAMAIVTAQLTMAIATILGDKCTKHGIGRKPLFMAAIMCLPIRCALIIFFDEINASHFYLLSTQVLDGISGGLFGLIHPYLIADITFGTGRFNVIMGVSASCFGLGATLSNYLGQLVVQHFGHIASLTGSLIISIVPILLFSFMPETYGRRGAAGGANRSRGRRRKNGKRMKRATSTSSSSTSSSTTSSEYQTFASIP